MSKKVADVMWELLANAGVKRCYGIVGAALNPVIDALRRNGKIEFIHVRHEEYGVFAIAGDVETKLMDTAALEELKPYKFFDTACLYVGRVVNPEQVRAVVTTAILT